MKKFTILKHPHPFLKKVTQAVAENKIDDILCHTINIMFNTMYESHGGGLAANQVGLDMRIFIMDNSTEKNQPIVALNPEILEKSGCVHEEEACLSFPGVFAKVKRAEWVKMSALNILGERYELESDGYLSRCIQHEMDHLNGITYFDHLSSLKRKMIEKKYKKLWLNNNILKNNPST